MLLRRLGLWSCSSLGGRAGLSPVLVLLGVLIFGLGFGSLDSLFGHEPGALASDVDMKCSIGVYQHPWRYARDRTNEDT